MSDRSHARSRSNRSFVGSPRLIAILVVTSLLTTALLVANPTASGALNGDGPADLIDQTQLSGGLYAATAAQQTALADLSQQAVANTLADHQLPAGDAAAAQTWGRADSQAELWALITQAIQTPAASRTTDQQNAVAWLTAVQQRQDVIAAQDAGLEYAKWAGLGTTAYQNLLNTHPTEASLETFLSVAPFGYAFGDGPSSVSSPDNEGYCAYTSPAPFQTEYTGNIYTPFAQSTVPQSCRTPCTSVNGCPPQTPSYDQFVRWGAADADSQFNTGQFVAVSNSVAEALGFGGAVVGAGVAGVALSAALSGALTGTALAAALSPFGGITGGAVGGLGTAALADASAGVAAVEVAGFAAIVIIAIAIAVVETINIFTAAALPGQLATAITNAATTVPALDAILADPTQAPGLFALFIGATVPEPALAVCSNSLLISSLPVPNPTPCLNAPPIPAATNSDPAFTVTRKGSATSAVAGSITFADAAAHTNDAARVTGHWFVQHEAATSDGSSITFQTLELHYTDWSGREQIAWLLGNVTSGFVFVTAAAGSSGATNPTACLGAGTCSAGPALQYVGTDGNDYSATLGAPAPQPPPVNPGGIPPVPTNTFPPLNVTTTSESVSPALPEVNRPVTLTALINNSLIPTGAGSVSFVDVVAGNATTLCANVAVKADAIPTGPPGGVQTFELEASASCAATFTTTGPHDIYATYDGSTANFQSSQAKLTINVSTLAPTITTLTSSPAHPAAGDPVTMTAVVSDVYAGDPTPAGTVTFTGGSLNCAGVALSATVNGSAATCTTVSDGASNPTINAAYSGDANTSASSGSAPLLNAPGPPVLKLTTPAVITAGVPFLAVASVSEAGVDPSAIPGADSGLGILNVPAGTVLCNTGPLVNGVGSCVLTVSAPGILTLTVFFGRSSLDGGNVETGFPITVTAPPVTTVTVSGTQTFGSASPGFSYTDDASPSTTVTGTLTCTTVDGGTAIGAALPGGGHTVDGSSCSGLSASGGVSVVYKGAPSGYVVAPAGQVLGFTAPATGVVGASAVLAPTRGASNNPVVLSVDTSSDPGVCSVAALTVSYLAPGNCVIDADEAGNTNYSAAPRITQTITVNQAPAFVLAGPPTSTASNQPYDYTFAASGVPAPTYSLAAGAPTWLAIDATSGTVSGTPPTTTKTFTYSVIASNVAGTVAAGPFKVSVVKTVVSIDLAISASCPTTLQVAASGTCTLTVKNASKTAIGNISAALLLPSALSKVSCTAGCVAHRNLFTWSIAALNVGATTTLTITVKALRPAAVGLLAAVVSPDPDPNPRNNIAVPLITIKRS